MINYTHEHWMQRALELANLAETKGEVPVGAVLVKENAIVGEGYNQVITLNDPTGHAEILALRDAATFFKNYRLPETTLYVTIEPCSMCASAIVHARIKHLVFAANEPKAGAIVSQGCFFENDYLNHQTTYQGGVLQQECSQLISDFFKLKRQK
ncbi:MAG: tRNA adenosine(34) deaminase TadA [SAR86 cluster bacterium]|uniref:tRNA-specific adenosine deaminase n=1 Tax=SAR86 cluster bacterium TaxID=2030880 RepID=A0A2A5CB67_9GAMM|nr:MAG: tRNA adenosine(34) deaminase TadA [SAR86 cluster bacterium]